MSQAGLRRGWTAAWPLASLCLLASSRWLLQSARPEMQSTNLTEAAGCLMAACFAAFATVVHGRNTPWSERFIAFRGGFLGGVAILAGPALAAMISDRYVNANDATLALCLTSVVIAVASSALGSAGSADLTARLWPGLAGIAGLLLLLPPPSLGNWRFDLALASMPLVVGIGATFVSPEGEVAASRAADRWSTPAWQISALVVTAAILGGLGAHAHQQRAEPAFSSAAAVLDALLALLTLVALR